MKPVMTTPEKIFLTLAILSSIAVSGSLIFKILS